VRALVARLSSLPGTAAALRATGNFSGSAIRHARKNGDDHVALSCVSASKGRVVEREARIEAVNGVDRPGHLKEARRHDVRTGDPKRVGQRPRCGTWNCTSRSRES